jgi:hypothetical protein
MQRLRTPQVRAGSGAVLDILGTMLSGPTRAMQYAMPCDWQVALTAGLVLEKEVNNNMTSD